MGDQRAQNRKMILIVVARFWLGQVECWIKAAWKCNVSPGTFPEILPAGYKP